jgi:hypothetical protein
MAAALPLTAAYAAATGSMMPQEVATPLPEPSGTCITGSWQQRCQSGRDSSPCAVQHYLSLCVELATGWPTGQLALDRNKAHCTGTPAASDVHMPATHSTYN